MELKFNEHLIFNVLKYKIRWIKSLRIGLKKGRIRSSSIFKLIRSIFAPCLANFHEDKWERRPGRWHVHVVNNLGAGKTLFAHCQSKNDDIGNRTIAPGAEITWSFKPNFFGTTLYWCYTRTDHEHTAFDVYWEESTHNWLRYRCNYKECFWIAKDDGFYIRVIPEKRDELIHKWEPGW
ncbi:unnamed protein product [Malus baccata var. baccata]